MGLFKKKNKTIEPALASSVEKPAFFDFIAIDFETACADMNSACSIGIAAVADGEIKKTFYSLIFADRFDEANISIHGIRLEDVKFSPRFSDILPLIIDFIKQSRLVVAHNAQFDMSVLKESAGNANIPDFLFFDSANFVSAEYKTEKHSLSECAKIFGIDMQNHHNALSDAKTCAQIILEASKNHPSIYHYIQTGKVQLKAFSALSSTKKMISHRTSHRSHGGIPHYAWSEKDITRNEGKEDPNHPLYGKNCLFTGEMERIDRRTAMQMVLDVGGIIKTTASKKIDYMILGEQDPSVVGPDGMSSKERKIYGLIENGCLIQIVREDEFLQMFFDRIDDYDD